MTKKKDTKKNTRKEIKEKDLLCTTDKLIELGEIIKRNIDDLKLLELEDKDKLLEKMTTDLDYVNNLLDQKNTGKKCVKEKILSVYMRNKYLSHLFKIKKEIYNKEDTNKLNITNLLEIISLLYGVYTISYSCDKEYLKEKISKLYIPFVKGLYFVDDEYNNNDYISSENPYILLEDIINGVKKETLELKNGPFVAEDKILESKLLKTINEYLSENKDFLEKRTRFNLDNNTNLEEEVFSELEKIAEIVYTITKIIKEGIIKDYEEYKAKCKNNKPKKDDFYDLYKDDNLTLDLYLSEIGFSTYFIQDIVYKDGKLDSIRFNLSPECLINNFIKKCIKEDNKEDDCIRKFEKKIEGNKIDDKSNEVNDKVNNNKTIQENKNTTSNDKENDLYQGIVIGILVSMLLLLITLLLFNFNLIVLFLIIIIVIIIMLQIKEFKDHNENTKKNPLVMLIIVSTMFFSISIVLLLALLSLKNDLFIHKQITNTLTQQKDNLTNSLKNTSFELSGCKDAVSNLEYNIDQLDSKLNVCKRTTSIFMNTLDNISNIIGDTREKIGGISGAGDLIHSVLKEKGALSGNNNMDNMEDNGNN